MGSQTNAARELTETGPLVFEAPPKLQGILLDMWQRPIPCDGGKFAGDVGLPGPDGGAGGKFLLLPPRYKGDVPEGYYVYRSGTANVFIFLRSFYQSLDNISPAVDVLKQCVIYPLGKKDSAKPMEFRFASGKKHEMLPRTDLKAFEELKWLVDTEGTNLAGADGLGMLAGAGIIQGKPFTPDAHTKKILNDAATTRDPEIRAWLQEASLDELVLTLDSVPKLPLRCNRPGQVRDQPKQKLIRIGSLAALKLAAAFSDDVMQLIADALNMRAAVVLCRGSEAHEFYRSAQFTGDALVAVLDGTERHLNGQRKLRHSRRKRAWPATMMF